jgi:hypothetical protein
VERLRALWPTVIAHARTTSPMLGTLLADTEVVTVEGGVVAIRVLDANLGHAEGIDHKRDALGKLVGQYVSDAVRIRVVGARAAEPAAGPSPVPSRPVRMTEATANAERLKVLRAKDPTLGAAVDALDLELLE